MSACNQREGKRRQEKMQDRYTQGMPRPLPVNTTWIEKPPKTSRGYDQTELVQDIVDTALLILHYNSTL